MLSILLEYRIINILLNRMSVLTYYLFQYRLWQIPESGAMGPIYFSLIAIFAVSVICTLILYGLIKRYRFRALFSKGEFYEIWKENINKKANKFFARQVKGPDFLSRIDNTVIMPSMDDDVGYSFRESSCLPSREMDTGIILAGKSL